MDGDQRSRSPRHGLARLGSSARAHPVIVGTFVVCTALGALLGVTLLAGDWSLLRRLLAGAVAGASTALLLTATKLYE